MPFTEFLQFNALLFIGCGLVAFRLPRRSRFFLRLVAGVAFFIAVVYLTFIFTTRLVWGWFSCVSLIPLAACVGILLFLFRISFRRALFYASIGYTMQNTVSKAVVLVSLLGPENTFFRITIYLVFTVAIYAALYFFFIRKAETDVEEESFLVPKTSTFVVSIVAVVVVYIISSYADYQRSSDGVTQIYALLCCILLLLIQFGMFSIGKKDMENLVIRHMLDQEHRQHQLSKENIEMINLKCHDLKHQIASFRAMSDGKQMEKRLDDLEKLVMIYDASVTTGNSALDIVLTEKKLYCEKHKIRLNAVVNAAAVGILSEEDTYSLFGNILDNAMEYLSGVEDPYNRYIDLSVTQKGEILVIHSGNYCGELLEFRNGLPVTTKQDKRMHGYGMASIKHIVDSYRGTLTVLQKDDEFSLNITIPLD